MKSYWGIDSLELCTVQKRLNELSCFLVDRTNGRSRYTSVSSVVVCRQSVTFFVLWLNGAS